MVKDDNNKKKDNKSDADLKKQLELAQKKIEEHANDLKRLQAEFENHIKRTDKEKQQFSELANADLIKKLLPVVDEFEHALKQINDKGVEMIFNNLMKVLHDAGLKEIEAEGLADPFKHEVLQQRDSDEKEGTILQVVQKGYEFKGRVLRPARVIIAKAKSKEEHDDKGVGGN